MIVFKDFIGKYIDSNIRASNFIEAIAALSPIFDKIRIDDGDDYIKVLKCFHEHLCGPHFNDWFAKEQVKEMYHTKKTGIICKGEVYDIDYARSIFNMYVSKINRCITVWDVYVALNAQYHDHVIEYYDWFGNLSKNELDEKVVCATINFWFKDEDAGEDKVWKYFKSI